MFFNIHILFTTRYSYLSRDSDVSFRKLGAGVGGSGSGGVNEFCHGGAVRRSGSGSPASHPEKTNFIGAGSVTSRGRLRERPVERFATPSQRSAGGLPVGRGEAPGLTHWPFSRPFLFFFLVISLTMV